MKINGTTMLVLCIFLLFTLFSSTASAQALQVNLSPQEAIDSGAKWKIDGDTEWRDSGFTYELEISTYDLLYTDVPGYNKPSVNSVEVTPGDPTVLNVEYEKILTAGSLIVNISPQAAVNSGALWSVDGGTTWHPSGFEDELAAGIYALTFSEVPGYIIPTVESATVNADQTTTINASYSKNIGALRVLLKADGGGNAPGAARWRVVGTNTWRASGFTINNLDADNYTVEFLEVSGWITPANRTIAVGGGSVSTYTAFYSQNIAIIVGKIVDEFGTALPFVSFTFSSPAGTFYRNVIPEGSGAFEIKDLPAGRNYSISISKDQYEIAPSNKNLNVNSPGTYNIGTIVGTYTPTNLEIYGTVKTEAGEPIAGLDMLMNGKAEATTDDSGNFKITGLSKGNYNLVPESTSKYPTSGEAVTVKLKKKSKKVDFDLKEAGLSIKGRVLDFNSDPLPNILVQLSGEGENQQVASTSNGVYSFKDLISGDYTVKIVQSNLEFRSSSYDITLGGGNITDLDFVQVKTVLTELKVGGITIYADAITQQSNGVYEANGNIVVGKAGLIRSDAVLTLNTSEGTISGNGKIYLSNIPVIGDLLIAQGAFEWGADLVNLFDEPLEIEFKRLTMSLDSFSLTDSSVTVGATVEIDFLVRTLEVSAEVTISKKGVVLESFSATISQIPFFAWELEDTNVFYEREDSAFGGGTTLAAKAFTLESSVDFYKGKLNSIFFSLEKEIPLYAPFLYLTRIAGGVENLLSKGPITIKAEADFDVGKKLGNRVMANVEGSLTIVLSGSFSIKGTVYILGIKAGTGGISYVHSPNKQLTAEADFSLGAFPKVKVDGEINFRFAPFSTWGKASAKIYFKAFGKKRTVGGVKVEFKNDDIKFEAKVLGAKVKAEMNSSSFKITAPKWAKFTIKLPKSGAPPETALASIPEIVLTANDIDSYDMPAGLGEANFLISWENGEETPSIVSPSGVFYDGGKNGENYEFETLDGENIASYTVFEPEAGTWTVSFPDGVNIGKTSVNVTEYEAEPGAAITGFEEVATNTYRIDLMRSGQDDEVVELFYAPVDDEENLQPIATTGELGEAFDYEWNTSMVPPGSYYLYSRVYDSESFPILVKYENSLTVSGDPAYRVAGRPKVKVEDDGLAVSWSALDAPNLEFYRIYYTDDLKSEVYEQFVDVQGNTTSTLLDEDFIKPGRKYRMAVGAVLLDGTHGRPSVAKKFKYKSKGGKNYPYFSSTPVENIKLGSTYEYKAAAKDFDRDTIYYRLLQAPEGMTINATGGLVTWDTSDEDVVSGSYVVEVLAVDEDENQETQRYSLFVNDPTEQGLLDIRSVYNALGDEGYLVTYSNPSLNFDSRVSETLPATIHLGNSPAAMPISLLEAGVDYHTFSTLVSPSEIKRLRGSSPAGFSANSITVEMKGKDRKERRRATIR